MTELQQELFTYLLLLRYISEDVSNDPFESLVLAIDVITSLAHESADKKKELLALARACDVAVWGSTEELAREWALGELEGTEQERRLLERVRLTMNHARNPDPMDQDSEPSWALQTRAVIDLVGSNKSWVGDLMKQARKTRTRS